MLVKVIFKFCVKSKTDIREVTGYLEDGCLVAISKCKLNFLLICNMYFGLQFDYLSSIMIMQGQGYYVVGH